MQPDESFPSGAAGSDAGRQGWPTFWRFAVYALIAGAIFAGIFLLWQMRDALMLMFGAIVIASMLLAIASQLRRVVPLSHSLAVSAATLLVLVVVVGFSWLMGTQVRTQFTELWEALPLGVETLREQFGLGGGAGAQETGAAAAELAGSDLVQQVASYGFPLVNAIFGAVVVVVAGVFLAIRPAEYRRGVVKLFPPSQDERIDETMVTMGRALRLWLMGILISMSIVGVLTGLGTWLLGLPAPLALALFATLTSFVPIVGPIVGAIPAILLAMTIDMMMVLWTVLLYVAVQQVESNMITPLVQRRMVDLPPAVFLFAVVVFGGVFGTLGVFFAAPLAVVTFVAAQKLWVRETLHEPTHVTGEEKRDDTR